MPKLIRINHDTVINADRVEVFRVVYSHRSQYYAAALVAFFAPGSEFDGTTTSNETTLCEGSREFCRGQLQRINAVLNGGVVEMGNQYTEDTSEEEDEGLEHEMSLRITAPDF